MDQEMTHERCSELLLDYAHGSLAAQEQSSVEQHLASCAECSAELAGVRALVAVDEATLSEHERARLERGVAWELGDLVVERPRRGRLVTRLAQGLGAAALLAVVGIALLQSLGGTSMNDSVTGGGGGSAEGARKGAAHNQHGVPAAQGEGAADAAVSAPQPAPSFEHSAGTLSTKKLDRLGEKSPRFTSFSLAYTTNDAVRLRDRYTADLVTQAAGSTNDAPSADGATVESCVDKVYDSTGSYSLLPAYGADATVDGRPALVLGFVWTPKSSGPLNQYMFWVFPTSSCETPIDYRAGQIHGHD